MLRIDIMAISPYIIRLLDFNWPLETHDFVFVHKFVWVFCKRESGAIKCLEGSYGPIAVIPLKQLRRQLTFLLVSHNAYKPSPVLLVVTGEGPT